MISKTYEMTLNDEYYNAMKDGIKTVEMRVCDEKRRDIREGDRIIFTKKSDSTEKISVLVKGCYLYDSFEALVDGFTTRELGFPQKEKTDIVELANGIYSPEKIKKFGALAIKIELESNL